MSTIYTLLTAIVRRHYDAPGQKVVVGIFNDLDKLQAAESYTIEEYERRKWLCNIKRTDIVPNNIYNEKGELLPYPKPPPFDLDAARESFFRGDLVKHGKIILTPEKA